MGMAEGTSSRFRRRPLAQDHITTLMVRLKHFEKAKSDEAERTWGRRVCWGEVLGECVMVPSA